MATSQLLPSPHPLLTHVFPQALVILIPLLGAPYLLTLMGPSRSESPGAYTVFQISRAIVLSSQVRVSSEPHPAQGIINHSGQRKVATSF